MNFVTISTNAVENYKNLVPIVSKRWIEIGFIPCIILCEKTLNQWYCDEIFQVLKKLGVMFIFNETPEGWNPIQVAQVSRIFAHQDQLFNDDDFIITSDADMYPINKEMFEKLISNDKFSIMVEKDTGIYDKEIKLPICYLGATVKIWREIVTDNWPPKGNIDWTFDERYIGQKVKEWAGNIEFIYRPHPLTDRFDKSDFKSNIIKENLTDVHICSDWNQKTIRRIYEFHK